MSNVAPALRPATVRGRQREDARTSRRHRDWLAREMQRRALTVIDLSKGSGVAQAAIYDFLRGRSARLSAGSVRALEPILPGIGGVMVDQLPVLKLSAKEERQLQALERAAAQASTEAMLEELQAVRAGPAIAVQGADELEPVGVPVRMKAEAGTWRRAGVMPIEEQEFLMVPLPHHLAAQRPFGLRVGTPGAGELYPDGTTLICVRPTARQVAPGRRVVLSRGPAGGKTEVTVREVVQSGDRLQLVLRDDAASKPDPLPKAFSGRGWTDRRGEKLEIIGLVAMACRPEQRVGA